MVYLFATEISIVEGTTTATVKFPALGQFVAALVVGLKSRLLDAT